MAGNSARFIHLTPDDLYWLGWLASDGCLDWQSNRGWRVILELKESDKALVERFAVFIGAKPPTQRKATRAWRSCLSSNVIGARLFDLGITARKSNNLVVKPELARSPHFWRGVFEGDGSYNLNDRKYPCVSFGSGSKAFLEQLHEFQPNQFGKLCKTKTNFWATTIYDFGDVRRFLTRIYKDSTKETRLERKYQLFSWMLPQEP